MNQRQINHFKHMCKDPQWAAQKIIDQQNEIRVLKQQNSRFMNAANHMFLFGCQCGPETPEEPNLCMSCTELSEAVMTTPGDYQFEMLMWADHTRELDRQWREDNANADREFLELDVEEWPDDE